MVKHGFLEADEKLDPKNLPAQMPEYISIWIMDKYVSLKSPSLLLSLFVKYFRCDSTDIYTNKPKPLGYEPSTYSHAQKMRAAMTHHFGRELGLGLESWTESQVNPGRYLGNPSLSTVVGQYMISLRRKKVSSKPADCELRESLITYTCHRLKPARSLRVREPWKSPL